ncbi:MAG: hypothetical protein LBQ87_00060, partial [Candidatus Fibromonas sp.]|nr:hypothetical protein [Candidatus Fibromonas sp.]
SLCNNVRYNPETQKCNNDNIIETKCGESYYITKTQYCSNGIVKNKETFTDDRDGQTYTYVVIGSQTWMAENLNYKVSNSFCYGDMAGNDVLKNCPVYGRLYDWTTAMVLPDNCKYNNCPEQINENHQGVCPDGWHIPTDDEWGILMETIEPNCTDHTANCTGAGLKLKATITWYASGNATDEYGFSALAAGRGAAGGSNFENMGNVGLWWSTLESLSNTSYSRLFVGENMNRSIVGKSSYWYSIRCVKN